ncbi:MAG: ATP-binding cassette domain-containing protein [Saprospiraceae bacterium]|nr:ATP-binding cassette domain-containing protein [Saprospiraceae bacterium]
MNNLLLDLRSVIKEYQSARAVDQVSFSLSTGCVTGLLGPNGAGKTSLIRIITGITRPDSGQVLLSGVPVQDITDPSIGYMPEERGLYKKMKVGEQLVYLCRLRGLSAKDAEREVVSWMKKFEITSWWNKRIDELSKGMSQKVQFIATVAHRPNLIILDEPFSGLDPINTQMIKQEIAHLKHQGVAILFSTHRMEQVEEMCDEIVWINKGKIILQGEVNQLKKAFRESKYDLKTEASLDPIIIDKYKLETYAPQSYYFKSEGIPATQLLLEVIQSGVEISEFKDILPTFNEIFIRLVNNANHE